MSRSGREPLLVGCAVLVLLLGTSALLFTWISSTSAPVVGYSTLLSDVAEGTVARVDQQGTALKVSTTDGGTYEAHAPTVLTDVYADITEAATTGDTTVPEYRAMPAPDTSWVGLFLTALLPFLAILIVFVLILLLIVRPARRADARGLADRLRQLDDAHKAGLITDDERERQRVRILNEV
jgi:hypothetical protein